MEDVREDRKGKWGELPVVRLESEEDRKKIMKKKRELRGGDIWVGALTI